MNFLAHYALVRPAAPALTLGNALPDLLPLASPRARFRQANVVTSPAGLSRDGVLAHLAADAAFHRTTAFAQAQQEIKSLLPHAGFLDIRLRPFFFAHVCVELALDAVLLREDSTLADDFYAGLAAADFDEARLWAEQALHSSLPSLPGVLTHFLQSRYLCSYHEDVGVAEGLSRVCARARQDVFSGDNFPRLTDLISQAIPMLRLLAPALLAQTRSAL